MTTTRSTGFIRSGEVTNTDLLRRSRSLGEAIESGGGRLPADQVERAREVQRKVATRTADIGSRTVVALAGATGSGKSSLFNALVGEPVSRIGARRPTTSVPSAAMWGDEPSDELLDRLQVAGRHQVPLDARRGRDLGGLLLLDLPDFDSRVAQHRAEADRVIEHADVLVWVTDPQKYADAVLHEEYIRTLAGHRAVSLVVLNQIDRLSRDQVTECVDDLRRLLDKDGLRDVEILAVSAARGIGVEDVAAALAGVVHERTAAQRRLLADLTGEVVRLREHVADGEVTVDRSAADELTEALCAAAGVPAVVDAVATDFRRHSARRGGWPFSRWLQRRG
ncbi:GTPase, partial [Rudaeicoccus suwonensis]